MRLASTADLKNRTSEMLRAAQSGEPVVVTRHGRPVAAIVGLPEGDLFGGGLAALAACVAGAREAVTPARGVRKGMGGAARFEYAAFRQPFGTLYVAFGPGGPAFARVSRSKEEFEREASRYLGRMVTASSAPPEMAREVSRVLGGGAGFAGPLDLSRVGPFEKEVLAELRRIPRGEVRTYGEVARSVGQAGAARAVGAACARNPLPLLIPCHRVVRSDGGLGGYSLRGGVALKERLLDAEGAMEAVRARSTRS